MIKTAFRVLITISFIILSVYFYIQSKNEHFSKGHLALSFDSESELEVGVGYLKKAGFSNLLFMDNVTVPVNTFFNIEEISLEQFGKSIDINDYRYTSYVKSLPSLFKDSSGGFNKVYVELTGNDFFKLFRFYYSARKNRVGFKINDPEFIRLVANFVSLLLILLLLGYGCRTRTVVTVISALLAYLFIDISSYYEFISFILAYLLIILLIESVSFSNRYVQRNNVGFIRIMLSVFMFIVPSFIPFMFNLSYETEIVRIIDNSQYDYKSLEKAYTEESPVVSNFFAHYAFQKSYLYGEKYKFPKENFSVKMVEFQKEDYYLKEHDETIMTFDTDFLESFIDYCSKTELGRFYLNIGRPFELERKSMDSSYKKEKEYMQIGILAVTMLLSSAFFKKRRR